MPGYIHITPGGGGKGSSEAAFLGPKYNPLYLGNGHAPANTAQDPAISAAWALRAVRRCGCMRATGSPDAAGPPRPRPILTTYEQAQKLMARREVFDVSKEPARELDRYGTHDFGRHCLLARRLLEAGVTFVQVTHSNYDTHNENFDFHLEQVGEFDQSFATLIDDLAASGLLAAHPGRGHVGVRPHAGDQLPLRPRPLGHRLVDLPGRRGDHGRATWSARPTPAAPRSSINRLAAATCSTPTSAPSGLTRPNRSKPTAV